MTVIYILTAIFLCYDIYKSAVYVAESESKWQEIHLLIQILRIILIYTIVLCSFVILKDYHKDMEVCPKYEQIQEPVHKLK